MYEVKMYDKIREGINAIAWIDSHSHVVHHNIVRQKTLGPYDVDPVAGLLLDFDNRLNYQIAGLDSKIVRSILDGEVPPERQKQILLSYTTVQNQMPYVYLMKGINELYDLDFRSVDTDNWTKIGSLVKEARTDFYGLLTRVYLNANIEAAVLNLWADR